MKRTAMTCLGIVGSATGATFGQAQTTSVNVHYSLSYQIVQQVGGSWSNSPNFVGQTGITGPGQGVLFTAHMRINTPSGAAAVTYNGSNPASPTNAGATTVTWDPSDPGVPPFTSGSGKLRGYWSGDLDLNGSGTGTEGTWSDQSANYDFSIWKMNLSPYDNSASTLSGDVQASGTRLTDIRPNQFQATMASTVNRSNDVDIWQGMWVPSSLPLNHVSWQLAPGTLGLPTKITAGNIPINSQGGPVNLNVTTSFAPAVIIVLLPTPSSLAVLALGGLFAARRRRPAAGRL